MTLLIIYGKLYAEARESVFYFEIKGENMEKVKDFFSDMKSEIKRIRWCKGKELWKNVLVTVATIIFFTCCLSVLSSNKPATYETTVVPKISTTYLGFQLI